MTPVEAQSQGSEGPIPEPSLTSTANRRLACALALVATLPIGLAWRLAPLHLAPFAFKYGGSALWASAVYWVVAILLPRRPSTLLATVAAVVATLVEFFKLVRWPVLDRFRDTLAGKLLLGRYFTFGALITYWFAIAVVGYADARLRRPRMPPS